MIGRLGQLRPGLQPVMGAKGEAPQAVAQPAEAAGDVGARRQDLLACLYGLSAVLELHYVQEEESYFALVAE